MIPRKTKTCKCGCGKEGYIWSHGMLKECWYKNKPQQPIKKTPLKPQRKPSGEGLLFDTIISSTKHFSFVSGLNIDFIDGNTTHNNCHHVLFPKDDYKGFRLYDKNIVLLTKYEHFLIHSGTEKQRQKYVKDALDEYGVVVDWKKLYDLKETLRTEYQETYHSNR